MQKNSFSDRLKYLQLFTLLLGYFSATQIQAAEVEGRWAMIERDAGVASGEIEGPRLDTTRPV